MPPNYRLPRRCFASGLRAWALLAFLSFFRINSLRAALDVHPGESIQAAVDQAARHPADKTVRVHTGIYRPSARGQALVHLSKVHDGVHLIAEGDVTLSAANPEIADRSVASFPAVVNHVLYLGDGISSNTVVRGFRITGANNYVTDEGGPEALEPNFAELRRTEGMYGHLFFFTDGGAIKIFGRSYPVLDRLVIEQNYASPCAGGISIEHRGYNGQAVRIENTVFRGNRAMVTGAALDLLPGSAAQVYNCLFAGNVSNCGTNYVHVPGNIDWPTIPKLVATTVFYMPQHGSGALTVFPGSRVSVDHCTFTGNFNGADDRGTASSYRNSIFWNNTASGGLRSGKRYELDIIHAQGVTNCFLGGAIPDLHGVVNPALNKFPCENPQFNADFVPADPSFGEVGYRPR